MNCNWCEGVGTSPLDDGKPCVNCDGTGVQQETYFEDYITCVHCGEKDEEQCEYPRSLQYDGDEIEVECHKCGKPMFVTLCVSYTYKARLINPKSI